MCRRIILCSLCCVLLCCFCLGVAMADDVPDDSLASNPVDDDVITAEDFFRDLGFDPENEEEISLFLTWLLPLEPGSEHDMALILSGSEYSELDPEKVYFLWQLFRDAISDADLYYASDGTGIIINGFGVGYIGWRQNDPSKIYLMQRLPTGAFDTNVPVMATIDLASIIDQRIAAAGVLTEVDLNPILQSLLQVRLNQHDAFSVLADIRSILGISDAGTIHSLLSNIKNLISSDNFSAFFARRTWEYDPTGNGIAIRGGDGTFYSVSELLDMNFEDLDRLLLTNFSGFDSLLTLIKNATVSTNDLLTQYIPAFANAVYLNSGGNILSYVHEIRDVSMDYLPFLSAPRTFSYNQASNTLTSVSGGSPIGITQAVNDNFKDLDSLLLKNFGASRGYEGNWAYVPSGSGIFTYFDSFDSLFDQICLFLYQINGDLVGFNDGAFARYSQLTFDENLNKKTKTVDYIDLLHAMVGIGSDIQNPLSQLQAVLAGDADLELHRNTQENIDSVTDNFTGSGDGSVSSGDISDASGLTSGIGNAFGGNQVSTGDAFMAATDSGNFNFFSEECAAALDAVAYPVAVVLDAEDDSWLDGFVVDEDGFYSVADLSDWSFLDYLGKEG